MKFLGSLVSSSGIEPDPEKLSAIAEWPIPKTLTELRAFVALASYYRRHVEGFAGIARPLHDLTRKNQPFVWTEVQQKAFEELKRRLCSYPILATPLPEGEYVVDTDALNVALGAVLQQRQKGKLRVIAYSSRVMDPAERNYCTTRKELLGIIYGLRTFRHYLLGSQFLLRTDHAALTSLLKSPEPVGQQARWLDVLAEYDFRIEHQAGSQHNNSDSLSRRPCGSRKCTRSDCLITDCSRIDNKTGEHKSIDTLRTSEKVPGHGLSLEIVLDAQNNDPVLQTIESLLQEPVWKENVDEYGMRVVHLWSQRASLTLIDGILHRNFEQADETVSHQQVLVPLSLRTEFLDWVHNDPTSGHFGEMKTGSKLQSYAYWPGWRKDVKEYVGRCDTCCRYRKGPRFHQGEMQNGTGLGPMQKFHVDLTGPHPRSRKGNVYLLTGICCFTKFLITCPLRDKSAISVARALVNNVFLIPGAVELQIHEQGTEFVNDVMRNLNMLLGVQDLRTTAYRPVANGQIERVHKTINAVFAKTVSQNLRDWCELAPFVTFAYNTSRHSSTTFSPFYLLYLKEPRVGIYLLLHKKEPAYQNFDQYSEDVRRKMQVAYKIVENQLKVVFDRAKRRYDARVRSVKFEVGDLCYFYSPRLFAGRGRKFRNQTSGPWKVIRKVNEVNYSIQKSPKSKAIIVHVDRMMKYFGEVPKSWLESEPKTVNLICCVSSTMKTYLPESENSHDTPATSSPDASSVSAIQGPDNQREPGSACQEDSVFIKSSKDTGFQYCFTNASNKSENLIHCGGCCFEIDWEEKKVRISSSNPSANTNGPGSYTVNRIVQQTV